jgi:Lrp/AsnC family transcriptional regulator for asnA, asnC and gidA
LFPTRSIDEIDAKILHILLKDGRKDFSEIAQEIGTSRNAVQKRYVEMKKAGIIVGATTQVDNRHLGFQAFAEFLLVDYYMDNDLIHERVKKEANKFHIFNHPDNILNHTVKGNLEVFALMRNLGELEEMKMRLAKLTAGRIVSYIWTGAVKCIPWNLSFGLFTKLKDEVYEKQSKSTVSTVSAAGEVDEIDSQIIDKLSQNSRMPFSSIAKELGIATDTVIRRYRKLKKNGTINTLIQIDPKKLGYNCEMETRIRLKSQRNSIAAINTLSEIPDIYFMTATSGNYDLHVFAFIRDIEHLLKIQNHIIGLPDFGKLDIQLTSTSNCIFPVPRYWTSTI